MEKHIDVLGYLLAAMVFSVGFLGARVHASYEAMEREVREQSWRVRNALLHGDPIGPAELADTIAVTRRITDRVASLSRLVNYGLFSATMIVYTAAMLLLADGASGPPEAALITTLVFLGGASVIIIGELDVRKVERDRRTAVAHSLVGWISGLADALAAGQLTDFGAQLAALCEMYPDWALLTELGAYLDLLEERPGEGLRRISELIDSRAYLYLTPVVGTACALAGGESAAGLRLLDHLAARAETTRHLTSLRTALALSWAHLEIMAQDDSLPAAPSGTFSYPFAQMGNAAPRSRQSPDPEAGGVTDRLSVLDIRPQQIAQTAALLRLSRAWLQGADEGLLYELAGASPLASAVRLVLPADAADPGPGVTDLLQLKDSAALETFGLIFLAQGRTRDALRLIERSIRIAPGSYRTHWGMAVVCHRLGWVTAAEASLQKMNTLSPDTPLLAVTRLAFAESGRRPDSAYIDEYFTGGCGTVESVELALLGIDPGTPLGTQTTRERFFTRMVETALTVPQPRPAPAEAHL